MKILLSTILSIAAVMGLHAQNKGMTVSNVKINGTDDKVTVAFDAQVGKHAAKAGYTLVATPVLVNGDKSYELPAIAVQRNKAKIASLRNDAAPESNVYVWAANGETVEYRSSVLTGGIQPGARLELRAVMKGCCSERETESLVIAERFVKTVKEDKNKTVYEMTPVEIFSTGYKVAQKAPYVRSASEFDSFRGTDADKFINDNRENSVMVYYRPGSGNLDTAFSTNANVLDELVKNINEIENSADSRISRVVIAGFASPEGTVQVNNKLSLDRAIALRNYVNRKTPLENTRVTIHDMGVDWSGLRKLVGESNMASKQKVLDIIDNTPVWDAKTKTGRMGALKDLDGGKAYRYMYDNIFPELRSAAYIRVYYENK